MSEERRYEVHEVRQILDLAIGQEDAMAQARPAVDGLTLTELQEVGREVGVPADRITQAVAAFEGRGEPIPRGRLLGLPISVGRVVPLPRSPSDREWELLIVELRAKFGGWGVVTSHGRLREWTHGSVRAFIEPTLTGHRLRLTESNWLSAIVALGGFWLTLALVMSAVLLGTHAPVFALALPAFLGLLGGIVAAGSAASLPRWARTQEEHMEHVGRYLVALLALPEVPYRA